MGTGCRQSPEGICGLMFDVPAIEDAKLESRQSEATSIQLA